MKKIILSIAMTFCLLANHHAQAVPMTPTGAAWWLSQTMARSLVISYALHWYIANTLHMQTDGAIDLCMAGNASFYSKKTRDFVQQQIKQCGITVPVIAITGVVSSVNQFAMLKKKDVFYLNIPPAEVTFLNDVLAKRDNKKSLSPQEVEKLDEICFIIAHEMNHVKTIVAGTSYGRYKFPWQFAAVAIAGVASLELLMFHNSNDTSMPFYKYDLPANLLLIGSCILYATSKHCDEEYACDVEGIEDVKLLRAGKKWMLTDGKGIVRSYLAEQSTWVQDLYRKYPAAMCALFTQHPHPDARAENIDRKIAALQS